jgi:hypothetical protein
MSVFARDNAFRIDANPIVDRQIDQSLIITDSSVDRAVYVA